MILFIIILIVFIILYKIDEYVNKVPFTPEFLYVDKEIELIGRFYCDPRVKITEGKHYLVLNEEVYKKEMTATYNGTVRFVLIKDDQEKLSWVTMTHFKIVENA